MAIDVDEHGLMIQTCSGRSLGAPWVPLTCADLCRFDISITKVVLWWGKHDHQTLPKLVRLLLVHKQCFMKERSHRGQSHDEVGHLGYPRLGQISCKYYQVNSMWRTTHTKAMVALIGVFWTGMVLKPCHNRFPRYCMYTRCISSLYPGHM